MSHSKKRRLVLVSFLIVGIVLAFTSWLRLTKPTLAGEAGAYIQLYISAPEPLAVPDGAWAMVQWIDRKGIWHTMDGSQGPL